MASSFSVSFPIFVYRVTNMDLGKGLGKDKVPGTQQLKEDFTVEQRPKLNLYQRAIRWFSSGSYLTTKLKIAERINTLITFDNISKMKPEEIENFYTKLSKLQKNLLSGSPEADVSLKFADKMHDILTQIALQARRAPNPTLQNPIGQDYQREECFFGDMDMDDSVGVKSSS